MAVSNAKGLNIFDGFNWLGPHDFLSVAGLDGVFSVSIRGYLGNALRGFARTVLDVDDTRVNEEHLVALQDLLASHSMDTVPSDLRELVEQLRKKHVVDSISISQTNGSLLASSRHDAASEVITASALFNYVQSEVPKSEVVLIKGSDGWNMLFKFNAKIFVVNAPMHLTTIELRAISNEVEAFLARSQKKEPALEQKKS